MTDESLMRENASGAGQDFDPRIRDALADLRLDVGLSACVMSALPCAEAKRLEAAAKVLWAVVVAGALLLLALAQKLPLAADAEIWTIATRAAGAFGSAVLALVLACWARYFAELDRRIVKRVTGRVEAVGIADILIVRVGAGVILLLGAATQFISM